MLKLQSKTVELVSKSNECMPLASGAHNLYHRPHTVQDSNRFREQICRTVWKDEATN